MNCFIEKTENNISEEDAQYSEEYEKMLWMREARIRTFTQLDLEALLLLFFFTLTDRASTVPSNIRGCQSGMWSAGQK